MPARATFVLLLGLLLLPAYGKSRSEHGQPALAQEGLTLGPRIGGATPVLTQRDGRILLAVHDHVRVYVSRGDSGLVEIARSQPLAGPIIDFAWHGERLLASIGSHGVQPLSVGRSGTIQLGSVLALQEGAQRIETHDDLLLVHALRPSIRHGLQVYRLSDSSEAAFLLERELGVGAAWAVQEGKLLYHSRDERRIAILDLSNLDDAEQLVDVDLGLTREPTPTLLSDLVLRGDWLYAMVLDGPFLEEYWRILAIDVSRPGSEIIMGRLESEPVVHSGGGGMMLDGDRLLCMTWSRYGHSLNVIDIADPSGLRSLSQIDVGYGLRPVLDGDRVYLANGGDAGIETLDLTDPASPTSAGYFDVLGDVRDLQVHQGRVYALDPSPRAEGASIHYFPVGVTQAQDGDYTETLSDATFIEPAGSSLHAFVRDARGAQLASHGLVRGLPEPRTSETVLEEGRIWDVGMRSNTAYLAMDTQGLSAFDLTDPASPTKQGQEAVLARHLVMAGDWAYAFHESRTQARIHSLNLRDGLAPRSLHVRQDTFAGMAASGDYVFVAYDTSNSLHAYHRDSEGSLEEVGALNLPTWPGSMALTGDRLYLLLRDRRIMVVDVSEPEQMRTSTVQRFEAMGHPSEFRLVVASDQPHPGLRALLYVTDSSGGIQTIFDKLPAVVPSPTATTSDRPAADGAIYLPLLKDL